MNTKTLINLVGNISLLEFESFAQSKHVGKRFIGKLAYCNPLGSLKGRMIFSMIESV